MAFPIDCNSAMASGTAFKFSCDMKAEMQKSFSEKHARSKKTKQNGKTKDMEERSG